MAVQWVQQLNLCLQRGWPLDLALALQDTLDALVDAVRWCGTESLAELAEHLWVDVTAVRVVHVVVPCTRCRIWYCCCADPSAELYAHATGIG